MKITVIRDTFTDNSTIGRMLLDDVQFCFTLEPRKDQSQGKPYCIPTGTYLVTLEMSGHFGEVTPHVQAVSDFTEIEIHPGNFSSDTEGCCLVGQTKSVDMVGVSRVVFAKLMERLQGQDNITITYTEEQV
jgi:hypothetical protein